MRDINIELCFQDVPDHISLDEIIHAIENEPILQEVNYSGYPVVEHIEEVE